jgi:hypothetical protein
MSHHKSIMLVSALAAAGVVAVSAAPSASAVSRVGPNGSITASCSGGQINAGRVYDSSGRMHPTAIWRLYYSTANGGTNCLKFWDNKSGTHFMATDIWYAGNYALRTSDWGYFPNYAGAVNIGRASGRCIGIEARIEDGGRTYKRIINSFHCGR